MAIVFALTVVLMQSAQAQTYKKLHDFAGGNEDGQAPGAGVTMDRAGNLYGTTYYGGSSTNGIAFKLTHKGSGFIYNNLHSFGDTNDGLNPDSKIVIGPDGSLYGATNIGVQGTGCGGLGCGILFNLRVPPTACKTALCDWSESVAYQFQEGQQGGYPDSAPVFDTNGNMFGALPGDICCGVVYELQRSSGGWTQSVLYSFTGGLDGSVPHGGVVRDQAGNLYGVTYAGGTNNGGVVYQLVPSGGGWTESVLRNFDPASDGINPVGGLLLDKSGNLYGTTTQGGSLGGGTVFMLSPAGGGWTSTVLYNFSKGAEPSASLTMDAAGNLYGTTTRGGKNNLGTIFKLIPGSGGWTYQSLKEFTSDLTDGALPVSDVTIDAYGHLYGTTWKGGTYHLGTVWEITQ
jgi:uncharacterized repeat protein (TIGR03803 family)